jgi:hypothetical protein
MAVITHLTSDASDEQVFLSCLVPLHDGASADAAIENRRMTESTDRLIISDTVV